MSLINRCHSGQKSQRFVAEWMLLSENFIAGYCSLFLLVGDVDYFLGWDFLAADGVGDFLLKDVLAVDTIELFIVFPGPGLVRATSSD